VLNLKWTEVRLERHRLELLDSKTGEKFISLNPEAEAILKLQERRRNGGHPFVFPGVRKDKPFVGLPKIWTRLRTRAGLAKMRDGRAFRIHDLRHNLASVAAGEGLSLVEIGKLLGHRNPATTARYAELVDAAQARAAARVGGALAKAMRKPAKGGGRTSS
jgi:integrase